MVRRRGGVVLGVVAAVVAVLSPPSAAAPAPPEPVRYLDPVFDQVEVTTDLVYGAAPDFRGRGTQHLDLDVYEPAGDTVARRPLVVLAFGGGFYFGDKEQLAPLAEEYARRGYVAASITYRLDEDGGLIGPPIDAGEKARIDAAKHDLQAAVRWLRSEASTYGVDPGKVAVGGVSAGAVTALATALTPEDPGSSGTPGLSSAVCTAVSLSGAADGYRADAGDAGAILFNATPDPLVPYPLAQQTVRNMRAAGLPTELVTYPGAGHYIWDSQIDDILERSSAWLVEHVVERTGSCAGPVDPHARSFATAALHDLLGRAPTADELARTVDLLDSGASRGLVLDRLTTSDEWLQGIVTRLYTDTLGRQPDAAGLEFWVQALRSRRYSVARVAVSFHAAAEHRRASGSVEAWVDDLYRSILGRPASPGDRRHWADQTAVHGPSRVASRIYGSLESRRTRVADLHRSLLGRAPDARGWSFWADRVATKGDLALARDLAASPEYRTRAIARFP